MDSTGPLFAFDQLAAAIDFVFSQTCIYTDARVVRAVLDKLEWPVPEGRFLDPSCGDGAFIIEALARLAMEVDDIGATDCVRGWEFHPGAVADARENVEAHLVSRGWSASAARAAAIRIVVHADFLTDGPPARAFNRIGGNPPYLKMAYTPELLRSKYGEVIPRRAMADLAHAFLHKTCENAALDAKLGFVLPDRVLLNETAADLREALGEHFEILDLRRLDPNTSFRRPKRRMKNTPPRVHPVELLMCRKGLGGRAFTREPMSPDVFACGAPRAASVDSIPLAAIADVRVAPWLGAKGVFVVDKATADALRAQDPCIELIPAVDAKDIDAATGKLREPRQFVIRTSKDSEPTGAVQEHLRRAAQLQPERARRGNYWTPPERLPEVTDSPVLVVPRISKVLRTVVVPAGVIPITHELTVVTPRPPYTVDDLAAMLAADDCKRWLADYAGRLEHGYGSAITSVVRRIPVQPRPRARVEEGAVA